LWILIPDSGNVGGAVRAAAGTAVVALLTVRLALANPDGGVART